MHPHQVPHHLDMVAEATEREASPVDSLPEGREDRRLELTLSMCHDLVYVSLSTIYARLLTKCTTS